MILLTVKEVPSQLDNITKLTSLTLTILSIVAILGGFLLWYIKLLVAQNKPNGGSSNKDQYNRIESMVSELVDKTNVSVGQVKELRREHQFMKQSLKLLVNNSTTGTFRTDELGRTVEVSNSLCVLLKRSVEDLLDFGWSKYIHPDDQEGMMTKLQHCLKFQTEFIYEYRALMPSLSRNKSTYYILAKVEHSPIFLDSTYVGGYGILTVLSRPKKEII